jgi:protein phosphatase PTC7
MRGLLAVAAAARAAASSRSLVAAVTATTVLVASAHAASSGRPCAILRGTAAFLPRAALCSAAAVSSAFQAQTSFDSAGVHVAAFMIPKPEGSPLGEDAFAICSKRTAFAVADGVGGWAEEGVDAGLYSRALMSGCRAALDSSAGVTLAQALDTALAPAKLIKGSSTAVLADIQGRTLSVLNVGDSGFIVLRRQGRPGGKASAAFFPVMRSYEQQYSFNFPFQLGTGSDLVAADAQLYRFVLLCPLLFACFLTRICPRSLRLQGGDIVLLGSDGVWDNVFDEEINAVCESVVNTGLSGGALAAEIARSVANYASNNAHDKSSVSPFYARYNRIRSAPAAAARAETPTHVEMIAVDVLHREANRTTSPLLPPWFQTTASCRDVDVKKCKGDPNWSNTTGKRLCNCGAPDIVARAQEYCFVKMDALFTSLCRMTCSRARAQCIGGKNAANTVAHHVFAHVKLCGMARRTSHVTRS